MLPAKKRALELLEGSAGDFPYAEARRGHCAQSVDSVQAYASDLRRLQAAVQGLQARAPKLQLLWTSISPQHFNTESGFFVKSAAQEKNPSRWRCWPLRQPHLASARNQVAEAVLGDMLVRHSQQVSEVSLFYVDTWDTEQGCHNQHPADHNANPVKLDCTHWCKASDVTVRWTTAVAEAMLVAWREHSTTE